MIAETLSRSLQLSAFGPEMRSGIYWALIGTGAALFLLIVLMIVRKIKRSNPAGDMLDTSFLEKLGAQGGLTPEEMRRVRDSMLRQAAQRERSRQAGASLSDLSLMASAGIPPEPKLPAEAAPPQSMPESRQATDEQRASQTELPQPPQPTTETHSQNDNEEPTGPERKVSLEVLLDKGLITREDYDLLKQRGNPS